MKYICTNCAKGTPTLVRVFSTPGSIQLSTCKGCGDDVDPYIEREWLLVVMDCVLHRPEAYRDVLYNREPFSRIGLEYVDNYNEFGRFRQLLRYSAIAALIRTYFWHTAKGEGNGSGENLAKLLVVLFQSFVCENMMAMATIVSSLMIIAWASTKGKSSTVTTSKVTTSKSSSSSFFCSKLYLAVTIPSFFHLVTVFALIWENSTTVCLLGTLFVLSLQRIAVATVMDERLRGENNITAMSAHDMFFRVTKSIPLVVGIVARATAAHIASNMISSMSSVDFDFPINCIGIPIQSSLFGSFCIS